MQLLPSYKQLKQQLPLTASQHAFIEQSRQVIRQILNGEDNRLLIIVGPCSIHDTLSAHDFAKRLKQLADQVSSHFVLIMRVYCEKPRTSTGWKGLLYDPYLDGSCDLKTGIEWTRQLLVELAALQVPVATEFLDPLTAFYYDDLISWGSIGARTSSSQTHRQLASCLSMPVGIKNGTAGNLSSALNGVKVARLPHTYIGLNDQGELAALKTKGNPDVHVVLRGGEDKPNYDEYSVSHTLACLEKLHLPQQLLIDCSHANSNKCHENQPNVFQAVFHQIREGNTKIKGLLLESHLYAGNQSSLEYKNLKYGISITDSCLDWATTERLIQWGRQVLTVESIHGACLSF